ncbi:DUF4105 domain-containing protein [Psychrobacter sp. GP33]|uniref:Lnb N-terminal periplasmic domain-containing protein n=1 Tax=Psychrobacter sp. GP33 TaxID=2758709 RepID=UPI0015FC13BB|nr:DUF4105 domain-containing protein [Psychrobacter sp. GP33]
MSNISNAFTHCHTSQPICQRTYLPLVIAGLLFSTQSHAILPTPLSLVTTGELAPTNADTTTVKRSITRATDNSILINNNSADNNINHKTSNSAGKQMVNSNTSGNANAEQLLTTWRQQVQTDNLAEHTTWRRLLYIIDDKKGLFAKKNTKSEVDDAEFFLTPNGQQDAAAELDALLVAMAEQVALPADTARTVANDSALCRFPARVQWLAETLSIDKAELQVACPELDDWMATIAPKQLSVMFAQEYLDNPISAFGHTLLRIDSAASAKDFTQIHHAYALNDTVDGDNKDNFALFAIKAMSGRYDNLIEIDPYPKKLADYLKNDERDTWTYQLDLTPAEVQQIMLHVWETKDLSIPYYFATDNCASEILRLIDVVRPNQQLLSQLPYVVIPSDVVNLLNREKLLTNTRYTPADDTIRQAQLNTAQKQARLGYQSLSEDDINNIASPIINPVSSLSKNGQTLLPLTISAPDNNPLDRHPMQRAHVGIGQRGDNSYIDVGLRAGLHDTLDRPAGFGQFFNLEGLAATLRFYDNDEDSNGNAPKSTVLQNFTLIRGRSFNPVNSAKKGKTWGASIEATRVNDGSQQDGTDHLVGSTTLEYGKSWAFGAPRTDTSGLISGEMPPQLCYAFGTGAVQGGRGLNRGYRVGAGVNAGCHYQINNQLRAQAELQLPYWYHGSSDAPDVRGHYWQPITTLGLHYDIDKKQALRLDASYEWQDRINANDDIKLAYMRYF